MPLKFVFEIGGDSCMEIAVYSKGKKIMVPRPVSFECSDPPCSHIQDHGSPKRAKRNYNQVAFLMYLFVLSPGGCGGETRDKERKEGSVCSKGSSCQSGGTSFPAPQSELIKGMNHPFSCNVPVNAGNTIIIWTKTSCCNSTQGEACGGSENSDQWLG